MKNREQLAILVVAVLGLAALAVFFFLWDFSSEEGKDAGRDEISRSLDSSGSPVAGLQGDDEKSKAGDREKIGLTPGEEPGAAGRDGTPGAGSGNRLTGMVVGENGIGVHEARIHFTRESALRFPGSNFESKIHADSDRDGSFVLPDLPETSNACLLVDHADCVKKQIPLGDFSGGSIDLGTIVLELGGGVSGYVRTREGELPVEGAEVTVVNLESSVHSAGGAIVITGGSSLQKERRAFTDGNGYFHVRGVEEGVCRILVSHDAHPSHKGTEVTVEKGRLSEGWSILLDRGFAVCGRVTDGEGNPVEGVHLTARSSGGRKVFLIEPGMRFQRSRQSRTDETGSFRIEGLDRGVYDVTASGGIWFPETRTGVETGEEGVDFVLRKGGVVHGRVTDSKTGDPVAGFDIDVTQARFGNAFNGTVYKGREAADRIGDSTEPQGTYLVEGVGNDGITLNFSAEGYAATRVKGITTVPGEKRQVDAAVKPEARITGVVLSPSGDPVPQATVLLDERKVSSEFSNGVMRREIRRSSIGSDDEEPEFSTDFSATKSFKSVTGQDGTFDLRSIPEGDYVLKAVHEEFVEAEPQEILGLESGERKTGVELALRAGGGIEGTVYGKDGKPGSGFKVCARALFNDNLEEHATSGVDGKYALMGLEPGFYSVSLKKGETAGSTFTMVMVGSRNVDPGGIRVAVEEGGVATVDLRDLPAGSIAGYVREAGKAAEGIEVRLFDAEGVAFMALKTARTENSGRYLLDDIEPGDYRVALGLAGVPDEFEEKVAVLPAARVERDFDLPSGRVTGRITDMGTGLPVAGVRIKLDHFEKEKEEPRSEFRMMSITMTASDAGPGDFNTFIMDGMGKEIRTDDEGRYEIRYLKEGSYSLTASGAGYLKGTLEPVVVREGKETSGRNISLAQGGTIDGRVVNSETGSPVPAIMVRYKRIDDKSESSSLGEPFSSQMTATDGNGRFRIEGLEAGRYRLEASNIMELRDGTEALVGSMDVTVRRGETEEVQVDVSLSVR